MSDSKVTWYITWDACGFEEVLPLCATCKVRYNHVNTTYREAEPTDPCAGCGLTHTTLSQLQCDRLPHLYVVVNEMPPMA